MSEHHQCGCGHEHHDHTAHQQQPTIVAAKTNVAIKSFMQGMAQLIATFEEITGAKVAANGAMTLTNRQQSEIPDGQTALLRASYARNLRRWHPEDTDKPVEDRRAVEDPGMISAFDLSPTLLTYVPENPDVLMTGIPQNTVQYGDLPGGPLVVMAGLALYLNEVTGMIEALGGTELTPENIDHISETLGVPTMKNVANGTAK